MTVCPEPGAGAAVLEPIISTSISFASDVVTVPETVAPPDEMIEEVSIGFAWFTPNQEESIMTCGRKPPAAGAAATVTVPGAWSRQ